MSEPKTLADLFEEEKPKAEPVVKEIPENEYVQLRDEVRTLNNLAKEHGKQRTLMKFEMGKKILLTKKYWEYGDKTKLMNRLAKDVGTSAGELYKCSEFAELWETFENFESDLEAFDTFRRSAKSEDPIENAIAQMIELHPPKGEIEWYVVHSQMLSWKKGESHPEEGINTPSPKDLRIPHRFTRANLRKLLSAQKTIHELLSCPCGNTHPEHFLMWSCMPQNADPDVKGEFTFAWSVHDFSETISQMDRDKELKRLERRLPQMAQEEIEKYEDGHHGELVDAWWELHKKKK